MHPLVRITFPILLTILLQVFSALLVVGESKAQTVEGLWVLDLKASTDIDPWREWKIDISFDEEGLTLDRIWSAGRYSQRDSFTVAVGEINEISIRPGKWMDQVYIGVFVPLNATRTIVAAVSDERRQMTVTAIVPLQSAQIDTTVTITSEYILTEDGAGLILTERRSSRSGAPLRYIFKRE